MTKKSSTKPTPNTPAPGKPEAPADVLATAAAPAAAPADASPVVEGKQLPSEDMALPPAGEGVNAADEVTGDGTGDMLPPLDVVAVIVTSEVEGFRRAGRAWSRTPTTVPIDELDDAAIIALEAEPLLQVVYVADHAEKAAG
jgi:hypothetical protein